MAYTLQTGRADFKGGKSILASEHLQFMEAGATLDAVAFGVGKIELGAAIARNTTTGKFEPYVETTAGTFEPGFDEPAILNIDVDSNGVDDIIVGEVMVRCSVYDAKLPVGATATFKAANKNIRYVKEF